MKTLIAIPCMDMMHTPFVKSLLTMRIVGDAEISFAMNSLVYDARNQLAAKAANVGFDRILWLDSDMYFDSDLMERLSAHLDNGIEAVSGLYVTRKLPIRPVVFSSIGDHSADFFKEIPDGLFECAGFGFGAVMMTTALVKRIGERFGYPFSPVLGLGEDLSFCKRATEVGAKLYCDSSINMGHVGFKHYTTEDMEEPA